MDLDVDLGATGDADPYFVLDVFTDTASRGNQLAVSTAGDEFDDATMQLLAREGISRRPSSSSLPKAVATCERGSSHRPRRSRSPATQPSVARC